MNVTHPFPAIMVHNGRIRFNTYCEEYLLQGKRIQVSKAGSLVIFRGVGAHRGFAWRREGNCAKTGCVICSRMLLEHTGLRPGKHYRLFPYKDGLAANTYEPLEV